MNIFKKIKDTLNSKKNTIINVFAPISGEIVNLKTVPDETFASGILGQGIAIKPTGNEVIAFMDGNLEVAFETGHAYLIQEPKTKIEVLLHLGIDTVAIDPKQKVFNKNPSLVQGNAIKVNTLLCKLDLAKFSKLAKSDLIMLLAQNENMKKYKINFHKTSGMIKQGELIFSLTNKD